MKSIEQTRREAAANLGIRNFDGSRGAYADLSAADQERMNDEVARIIVANPQDYTSDQLDIAARRINSPVYGTPLESYTIGQKISDFASGAKEGATAAILPQLQALGWIGRNAVWLGLVGAGAVALHYFAPSIASPKRIAKTLKRKG